MCCTGEPNSDEGGKSGGIQCIVFRMFELGKCVKTDRSVRKAGGQSGGVMWPKVQESLSEIEFAWRRRRVDGG